MSLFKKPYNKYFAKRVSHAGYSFASKAESELFSLLKLLEKNGEIRDIEIQNKVYLTNSRILYIADFKVFSIKNNKDEWHEFKGFETSDWRIKRRLWEHYGPGKLTIWKKSGCLFIDEELVPK